MTISDATVDRILERAIAIQQVAAPTFHEAKRADLVRAAFADAGLNDVAIDGVSNVYGRLRGSGSGACLLVSAHLDTVFPAGTDLTVTRGVGRIAGPGIGDNALGVAPSEIDTAAASTDANIPLSKGCPAVCIGLTRGHNLHRGDEYIETGTFGVGLAQLLLLFEKLQSPQWTAS